MNQGDGRSSYRSQGRVYSPPLGKTPKHGCQGKSHHCHGREDSPLYREHTRNTGVGERSHHFQGRGDSSFYGETP
ncbi:Hypothetical predicted protein [Marmota monax]|uniref:Uncharacterized protein n=1 Tax=Marmota monax TaxID=9995 RepID=A0A5E4CMG0_MARMO|nr:hypothetical protein GHT09_005679 [Marmota monax]VTJ82530.1 Hypothetical predicted protein [Marmota monax]